MAGSVSGMTVLADSVLGSIEGSPTPYHCTTTVARRLDGVGFQGIDAGDPLPSEPGRYYRIAGGSITAWVLDGAPDRFVVVGAHTDSPNLRVRSNADLTSAGWRQLGVEVYGGVLLNSWLDRDLGLAGRVMVRSTDGPAERLFCDARPILRIPQLAIHLDREIREAGLKLDPQGHVVPLWASGGAEPDFGAYLAGQVQTDPEDVLAWDVMAFDTQPPAVVGLRQDLVASARIDNQLSCFAGADALAGLASGPSLRPGSVAVLALFDHEEVGSQTATGADGSMLGHLLERIALAAGMDRRRYLDALSRSYVVSADGAHATHPNYVDKHEPNHQITVNEGVVVKRNANQRYASDAVSEGPFRQACADAGVPTQTYIHRNDLPCGSTIGPATAAALGVRTVDVGAPQLAMHSARELCGVEDIDHLRNALAAVWNAL